MRYGKRFRIGAIAAGLMGATLSSPASPAFSQPTSRSTTFLPFFDQIDNPVAINRPQRQTADISPPPPALTLFDQSVLRTCGPIGQRVTQNQIRQLLAFFPDVVQKAKQAVRGELFPGRRRDHEFLDDLVNIWSKQRGFEHIFCGELNSTTDIGGLHFYGRYWELQQQGIGGRLPNNSNREEVVPGLIYTLGVVIRQGNQTYTDTIKGYAYVSSALELFLDATQAFKLQNRRDGACLQRVYDADTNQSFQAVFVSRQRAIVTFYPDATPSGQACGGQTSGSRR